MLPRRDFSFSFASDPRGETARQRDSRRIHFTDTTLVTLPLLCSGSCCCLCLVSLAGRKEETSRLLLRCTARSSREPGACAVSVCVYRYRKHENQRGAVSRFLSPSSPITDGSGNLAGKCSEVVLRFELLFRSYAPIPHFWSLPRTSIMLVGRRWLVLAAPAAAADGWRLLIWGPEYHEYPDAPASKRSWFRG